VFLVFVLCLALHDGRNCSLKFQYYVGWGRMPSTMNRLFFKDIHFHCTMNFKKRNIGLEANFRGHNQKNDETP
jgi:hypothetical protein